MLNTAIASKSAIATFRFANNGRSSRRQYFLAVSRISVKTLATINTQNNAVLSYILLALPHSLLDFLITDRNTPFYPPLTQSGNNLILLMMAVLQKYFPIPNRNHVGMNSQQPSRNLNDLIVGCWQLDNRSWKKIAETDIAHALDTYISLGIHTFDTADIYGRSEEILGTLLKKRDCRVFTKAFFFSGMPSAMQVRNKIETSLHRLQRDVLDSVQVHWHNPNLDFASTFDTLNELVEHGKIHQIGVTNFNTTMLEKALRYAPIHTHQIQYNLIDRRVEASIQALCLKHNIQLLTYGPLAGGFLSDKFRGVKQPQLEPDHARSFYYSSMIQTHGGWPATMDILETLAEIGQKYSKSISQVALNWVRQQPGVSAVVSGLTLARQQIQSNVDAFSWSLSPEDVELLSRRSTELFSQPGDIYSYERN
jgi:aryl-alcohol dehydrogenase-like predicted oxidoreductase